MVLGNCLFIDEVFLLHEPWFEHPENPDRLHILLDSLDDNLLVRDMKIFGGIGDIDRNLPYIIHSKEYIDFVVQKSLKAPVLLDSDTYISKKSLEAALSYLSYGKIAVEYSISGECKNSFILGRPPGHHAGKNGVAMGAPTLGFCLFNTSALVSKLLSEESRVLHIDFDLHHGNGTQDILYDTGDIVHIDFHQDPSSSYPGSGWPSQTGIGDGKGSKINIVLPPYSGDDVFLEAVNRVFKHLIDITEFDFIVFSMGFDAHINDGLGLLRLTSHSYHKLAEKIVKFNDRITISVLEGGYGEGLVRGAPAFFAGILGKENPILSEPTVSSRGQWNLFEEYWKQLLYYLKK